MSSLVCTQPNYAITLKLRQYSKVDLLTTKDLKLNLQSGFGDLRGCFIFMLKDSQDVLIRRGERLKTCGQISSNQLTLCPVCHQVHLAVRALPQLADVFILLGYVCCRQRSDGQCLHVLNRHRAAVTHLGCRGAPATSRPSWPGWRKRQARLDAVGQTK